MKKFYTLTVLLLVLVQVNFGQIILTSNSMQQVGEKQKVYLYDTTGVKEGPAGSNQTWNFSNLVLKNGPLTLEYVNPASTTFGSQFATSNYAVKDPGLSESVNYLKLTNSEFVSIGATMAQQGGTTKLIYSDPQKMFTFPFAFGSLVKDDFEGTSTNTKTTNTTYRKGSLTILADGTGKITLPSGAIVNALRIKGTQIVEDSTYFGFSTYIIIRTKTTSYSWFAENIQGAVFIIHNLEYSSLIDGETMGSSSTKVVISYDAPTTNIFGAENDQKPFSIYPNPAKSKAYVEYELDNATNVKAVLKDLTGKELAVLDSGIRPLGANSFDLSVESLSSGIYFVEILTEGNKYLQKLIVE